MSTEMPIFEAFPKIPRLVRGCHVYEKIDGTNAQIFIGEDGTFLTGSRNRWITPESDNFGFARWAMENKDELMKLGPGRHFGEWWGLGIQRGYGLDHKRFSLFNAQRWGDGRQPRPACCHVVPTIFAGDFNGDAVGAALTLLKEKGSFAAPGFMNPEGVVVYHGASRSYFKQTIEKDSEPKGLSSDAA